MHLYEHEGTLHIVKDGKVIDAHSLSGPSALNEHILLVTEDGINGTERVADLFRKSFCDSHNTLFLEHAKRHNKTLIEIAWQMADNLLEAEITKIEHGEKGVFPHKMLAALKKVQDTRTDWINEILFNSGGNMANKGIHAQRVFATLSAGEKRRLLVAVAETAVDVGDKVALILDEPLAHLDSHNRQLQLGRLRALQEKDKPVALIIVSHENIDELQNGLLDCNFLNLEQQK